MHMIMAAATLLPIQQMVINQNDKPPFGFDFVITNTSAFVVTNTGQNVIVKLP